MRTTYGSAVYADHVPRARPRRACARSRPRARSWSARPTPTSSRGASAARTPTRATPATRRARGGSPAARAAATRPRSRSAWARSRWAPTPAARCACRPRAAGWSGSRRRSGRSRPRASSPLVPELDTVGPMARTVADCALAWSVLSGEPVPEPRAGGQADRQAVRPPEPRGGRSAGPHDPATDALPGEPVELAGARGGRVAGVLRRRRGVAPRRSIPSAPRSTGR